MATETPHPVTRIELDAVDRTNGMTLAEVADFVATAYRLDMDPQAIVRVRNGFRSQIQSLAVPK